MPMVLQPIQHNLCLCLVPVTLTALPRGGLLALALQRGRSVAVSLVASRLSTHSPWHASTTGHPPRQPQCQFQSQSQSQFQEFQSQFQSQSQFPTTAALPGTPPAPALAAPSTSAVCGQRNLKLVALTAIGYFCSTGNGAHETVFVHCGGPPAARRSFAAISHRAPSCAPPLRWPQPTTAPNRFFHNLCCLPRGGHRYSGPPLQRPGLCNPR